MSWSLAELTQSTGLPASMISGSSREEQPGAAEQVVDQQRRLAGGAQLDDVVPPAQPLNADQVAVHLAVALQHLVGVLRVVHELGRQELDVRTALGQHLEHCLRRASKS